MILMKLSFIPYKKGKEKMKVKNLFDGNNIINRELDELKAVEAIEALKKKPIEALNNLVNMILGIDKTRVLIGVPSNPQIKHFINTDLEKGSENQKERLIVFLNALMQTGGGAITLKICNEDNTFDVCGIMLKFNGEWFITLKAELIFTRAKQRLILNPQKWVLVFPFPSAEWKILKILSILKLRVCRTYTTMY